MVNITDKTKCSGCAACANICPQKCITMVADNEGYLYPKIDESRCIKCGLCSKVCPIINSKQDTLQMPEIYACYAKDEQVLLNGSSGGIFCLLAASVLNKGGVVYGAAYVDAYNIQHIRVDNIADLIKLQKSKYVQSNLGTIYQNVKQDLTSGKRVLFSGTGCQIEGLLNYLVKPYTNLVTIDVVCHGVPSPKVWQNYLKQHKVPKNANVDFRYKATTKSGAWKNFELNINASNKSFVSQPHYINTYMKSFLCNCNIRPCCYDCKFKKVHRKSDITLGDFWGVDQTCPEMYNANGTSVVFVHSKKGEELFKSISSSIVCKSVTLDQAAKYNICYLYSVEPHKNRDKFFKQIDKVKIDSLVKKYCEPTGKQKFLSFAKRQVKKFVKLK